MNFLFACGCPRSGTTALGNILNAHPLICVGVERYRQLAIGPRGQEFLPDLFEPERFMQIDDADTSALIANRKLFRKFNSSRELKFIGDKIPRLYTRLSFIASKFPDARLVYIFRDPLEVAYSWQKRADNPADGWPSINGRMAALTEWVKSIELMAEALPRWEGQAIILNYANFFNAASPEEFASNIARLYAKLGLRMQPENLNKTAKIFWREAPKPLPLPEDQLFKQKLKEVMENKHLGILQEKAL